MKKRLLTVTEQEFILSELKKKTSVDLIKKQLGTSHNKIQEFIRLQNIEYDPKKAQRHEDRLTTCVKDYFIENSSASNVRINSILKQFNILDHINCNACGLSHWGEVKLTLDLHHINGINTDNRIENLCYLCPNCHSITETYRKGAYHKTNERVSDADFITALNEEPNIRRALRRVGLTPRGNNYERAYRLINENNILNKHFNIHRFHIY